MPDWPYVYGIDEPAPVSPSGTRVRVTRRRPREEPEGESHDAEERHNRWRELLEEAVAEMNGDLKLSGSPHRLRLEEDGGGFWVRVEGEDGEEGAPLDPARLAHWLEGVRSRLGVVVDERA